MIQSAVVWCPGSIKTLKGTGTVKNPLVTLRIARVNPTSPDKAIDHTKSDLGRYIRTREEDSLVFHEGSNPHWFEVKRLPQAFLVDVLDGIYPLASRRMLAARAAVHVVTDNNGPVKTAEGHALVCHEQKTAPKNAAFVARDGEHGVDIAPLEFIEALGDLYGAECIQELGQVALDFARLPRNQRGPFTSWGGSVASG